MAYKVIEQMYKSQIFVNVFVWGGGMICFVVSLGAGGNTGKDPNFPLFTHAAKFCS